MIVGAVMLAYVLFGGMLATTWVQIVKAVLLMTGAAGADALLAEQTNTNAPNVSDCNSEPAGSAGNWRGL